MKTKSGRLNIVETRTKVHPHNPHLLIDNQVPPLGCGELAGEALSGKQKTRLLSIQNIDGEHHGEPIAEGEQE